MTPADVQAFVSELEADGLIFRLEEEAVDVAVVDQMRGLTIAAPWLQVIRVGHGDKHYLAAALAAQQPTKVAMPHGWKFEGSLSNNTVYVASGTEDDRIKFLRQENGLDVYLDLVTGKEVFVGRPTIDGDTEAALFTRLRKICQDALNIDAEIEPSRALGDAENAAPLFEALQGKLLPEAERIVTGPGREVAFAHFTCGLILRILRRQPQAELAFRKACDLQPSAINTLRELVRCLGGHVRANMRKRCRMPGRRLRLNPQMRVRGVIWLCASSSANNVRKPEKQLITPLSLIHRTRSTAISGTT